MRPKLLRFLIPTLFGLMLATPSAPAAIFHVTNGEELADALFAARDNGQDDTIYLARGTYSREFTPGSPVAGFSFYTTEGRSLTIRGEAGTTPDEVIIDGHNRSYCLEIYHKWYLEEFRPPDRVPAALPEVRLMGLTLRNGDYEHDAGGLHLEVFMAHVTVKDCRIINNVSRSGCGGGGRLFVYWGDLVVENTFVLDNLLYERERVIDGIPLPACEGGGLYIRKDTGVAVVKNIVVAGNEAYGHYGVGGGMYLDSGCYSTVNLTNNTIVENSAVTGGGFFAKPLGFEAILNVYNNIIHGNGTPEGDLPTDFWTWGVFRHDGVVATEVYAFNNDFHLASSLFTGEGDNLDAEPRFEFPGDFHLAADSPLLNQGTFMVPPPGLPDRDFDSNARVCGTCPDIGADERCGPGPPLPFRPPPGITIGPVGLLRRIMPPENLPMAVSYQPPVWSDVDQSDRTRETFPYEQQGPSGEWWIYLQEAKRSQKPSTRLYLTPNGWTSQARPYRTGLLLPAQLEEVGRLCPQKLKLKEGLYELWFAVDEVMDNKISDQGYTAGGMYVQVVKNFARLHQQVNHPWRRGFEPPLPDLPQQQQQ